MSMTLTDRTATQPSTTSFSRFGLRPATLAALAQMGITEPTPIQASAIPALMAGEDVMGQARTGSGKTLAFMLPAIERVDARQRQVQIMVLTPTRELAVQIADVTAQVAGQLSIVTIVGGRSDKPQVAALRRGAQVLIGTPGRILDLLQQGALMLNQLRFLVLDEADNLLDQGFGPDVDRIIKYANRSRQTALFSATMPDWVERAARKYLHEPRRITIDAGPQASARIDHYAVNLAGVNKHEALRELLDHRGKGATIVFGRTKHGVRNLARKLEREGYPVAALQGNLSQNARDRVMADFRAGVIDILVATNVAARGLDVNGVDLVINVELPESSELLTHRIGRTGRMEREGQAITLLSADDLGKWRKIKRELPSEITEVRWNGAGELLGNDNGARRSNGHRRAAISRTIVEAAPAPRTTRSRRLAETTREREQHEIVCSSCGQSDLVPFKPDPTRPIYCSACFTPPARRTARRRS
ncbi:MAG TPA: DEAD/DEAH box helicase [Thermomicrobiales bacterium]|nr:DEAD/DEAH box helicase [Thermomicrobiales bacterium]